jgi:hypothetical protein
LDPSNLLQGLPPNTNWRDTVKLYQAVLQVEVNPKFYSKPMSPSSALVDGITYLFELFSLLLQRVE